MNRILLLILPFFILLSCENKDFSKENITITEEMTHYRIVIDYRGNLDYMATGEVLGEGILYMIPDYEKLVDSYLFEMTKGLYEAYIAQSKQLAKSLPENYYKEMIGIATNFSANENVQRDGRLSKDEYILFNLLADVIPRVMGCSFIGINSDASVTGDTILSRNLEWFSGKKNQLGQLHAITEFKSDDINSVSIGFAGIMGIVTGANDQNIFTGILDSPYKNYSSRDKFSYMFEIRKALENSQTIDEMVEYVSKDREYMRSFLLALSNNKESVVLENYQRSIDSGGLISSVREWDSELNYVKWDIDNSIAAVNSFLLPDFPDNHFYKHNKKRLEIITNKLKNQNIKINKDHLRDIVTTRSPSKNFLDGDIYSVYSQQIILYRPETFTAEIFFYPKSSKSIPEQPAFETIILFSDLKN